MVQGETQPTALAGKAVIISGGARGIGGGVGRLLVARGAQVVLADMLEAEGTALAAELGERAVYAKLDVTDEAAWAALVAQTVARLGRLDGLVNCAGILRLEALVEMDRAVFDQVLQVNLTGTFLGMKHAAPAMGRSGGGGIVNLSSTEGLQGSNSMAAYAASKWGVRGLTKVAAVELGAIGVRVNSIHPGPINTPMLNPNALPTEDFNNTALLKRMPIRRVADTSEVGELVAFLVSDASRFITAAEIAIDGGLTAGMFLPTRPGAPPI